jgi:hypothetical protein
VFFAPIGFIIDLRLLDQLLEITLGQHRNGQPNPSSRGLDLIPVEEIVFGVRNIVQQNELITLVNSIKQSQPRKIHRLMNAEAHIFYGFEGDYFL